MKKIFLIPLLLFSISTCNNKGKKSPLQWCVWEIHKHENYDCEWSYIYNEIQNHDDMDNLNLSAYYIKVFTGDRIGEWCCYIECDHKSSFDRAVGSKVYSWEEVKQIDCDLCYEILL